MHRAAGTQQPSSFCRPVPSPCGSNQKGMNCTSHSLYASTFANATVVSVKTSAQLNATLLSSTNPLIVKLAATPGSSYVLERTYTYSGRSICIEVCVILVSVCPPNPGQGSGGACIECTLPFCFDSASCSAHNHRAWTRSSHATAAPPVRPPMRATWPSTPGPPFKQSASPSTRT